MAEEPTNNQSKTSDQAANKVADSSGDLETSNPALHTGNDGSIPINKPAVPTPPKSEGDSMISTPQEKPETITVTDEEVEATKDENEHLASQVEVLSGEIQALEAKIDRLTGNALPSSTPSEEKTPVKADPSKTEPPKEAEKPLPPKSAPELHQETPTPMPQPPAHPSPSSVPPVPNSANSGTKAMSDIYSSLMQKQEAARADSGASVPANSSAQEEQPSSMGVMGEVLAVFGLIVFVIMLLSPVAKSMVALDIFSVIRTVGWPTATLCLFLGFIMLLFAKGKSGLKVVTVIFLLISLVMLAGIFNQTSLLGPLKDTLQPLLSFYQ